MEKIEKDKKRYQKGKIYSIRSHQTDDIYIGSTINTLPKRIYHHKFKYKLWIDDNVNNSYYTSFQLIQYDDCYIELIENFPCNCKNELERQEGIHIRNINNCINKIVVGRTRKEYREDNKEKIIEDKKEYYSKNKEQIIEKEKERYAINKDSINQKRREKHSKNIESQEFKDAISQKNKEYRAKNIDSIIQYDRERYSKNKDVINQKRREKRASKKLNTEIKVTMPDQSF